MDGIVGQNAPGTQGSPNSGVWAKSALPTIYSLEIFN